MDLLLDLQLAVRIESDRRDQIAETKSR